MIGVDNDCCPTLSPRGMQREAAAALAASGVLQIGEKKARGGLNLPGVWLDLSLLPSDPHAFRVVLRMLDRLYVRHFYVGTTHRDYTLACVMSGGAAFGVYLGERYGRPIGFAQKDGRVELQDRVLAGQRVVPIEDVVTEGGSTARTVEAIRARGGVVTHAITIVNYGLTRAEENFRSVGIECYAVTTMADVISAAHARGMLSDEQVLRVARWIENPS